ncbi:MAG: hypothetical protein IJ418_08415 [Clostridia bacterium]|nr:hypothetical protein [Clostridia bacterium]
MFFPDFTDEVRLSQCDMEELLKNIEQLREVLCEADPNKSYFSELGKARSIPISGDEDGVSILTANHFGLV